MNAREEQVFRNTVARARLVLSRVSGLERENEQLRHRIRELETACRVLQQENQTLRDSGASLVFKYATEDERVAARRAAWRRSKQRQRVRRMLEQAA